MADDACSDCGHLLCDHVRRGDGLVVCPAGTSSISASLCQTCHEHMGSHVRLGASIYCPQVRPRSVSPDPFLLATDRRLSQRCSARLVRCSAPARPPSCTVAPLGRSSRLDSRRRNRAEPYVHAQAKRSTHRTADVPIPVRNSRRSRVSVQVSVQDNRTLTPDRSYENEYLCPARCHPDPPRRESVQQYVDCLIPVENMDRIEGFRPFTELDPGQEPVPVTVREDLEVAPQAIYEFVWDPSAVIPEVGGMRVRVGHFERVRDAAPCAPDDGNETVPMSGIEDNSAVQGWSSSSATPAAHHSSNHTGPQAVPAPTFPGLSQAEFTQGSAVPLQQQQQQQQLEYTQFEALVRHYAAAQNQAQQLAPLQNQPLPPGHAEGSASPSIWIPALAFDPSSGQTFQFQYPLMPTPTPTPTPTPPAYRSSEIEQQSSHAAAQLRQYLGSAMPADPSVVFPYRAQTEPAVERMEDWAALHPWEYVHRVLTTSSRPLVMFVKLPTEEVVSKAAFGALGVSLKVQVMMVNDIHWLLVGPQDVSLYEFGVKFYQRSMSPQQFNFRFGELYWGANVDQIENEVTKATEVKQMLAFAGMSIPAALPVQFTSGPTGGFVIWCSHSLI